MHFSRKIKNICRILQISLYISKKNLIFAADLGAKASHTRTRMYSKRYKIDKNMETTELKQMPVNPEYSVSTSQSREYYTVDEAMAYLEPRIRAMFR